MSGGGGSTSGSAGANSSPSLERKLNQTLRGVQRLLKGRSFTGKNLLPQKFRPLDECTLPKQQPQGFSRSYSENDIGPDEKTCNSVEADIQSSHNFKKSPSLQDTSMSSSNSRSVSLDVQSYVAGARATDTARVARFIKELSRPAVMLERLRELSWSGIPPYMRHNIWRLLLGYAPPNSDRREGILTRKRLDYADFLSHYYDIPESERSDDEINMLRQIAVDCPRTVPEVTFFHHARVQKSLERILYTWATRHPASGYVQGINDLVTPFLIVFISEHLKGSMETWSISDLSPQIMSNIEADCYWCLSKLLDGIQDNYTFAQPGIQRLVFRLKELVQRIDEPVSRHMEEQGLDFLQFAFRWFNCLLIREIPFHLVTRLWDTYLAEVDALPDFLVYISASLLLTWSDKLQKLDFQEMVMFLQHLPTNAWTHDELEIVLSRAYMWHTMFNSSPSHLAS